MLVCKELSGRTYSNRGVPEGVHVCSHHRDDPDLIAKKAKIDAYHIELLAYFLQKLQGIQDGDGTLLDALELLQEICEQLEDRKSTRLNSSHTVISYAVF